MNKHFNHKVFIDLKDLLAMEPHARNLRFLARKQKVRSVLGGKHASKLRGRGLDFEEVRNYVPGDDIRNIDWKVTARTQKTHSKVYSEEKEKPALVVVDQSSAMFYGSKNYLKSVIAAKLAALVSFMIQKQGDRIGGLVFNNQSCSILLPKRDRRNLLRFFEILVEANQSLAHETEEDFDQALKDAIQKTQNIVSHDYLVFVISDFHRYSPKTISYLAQLSRHNDVIAVKVWDPSEREFPDAKIMISHQKHQLLLKGDQKKINRALKDDYDENLLDFEHRLKKHHIPLLKFDTLSAVEDQWTNVFTRE